MRKELSTSKVWKSGLTFWIVSHHRFLRMRKIWLWFEYYFPFLFNIFDIKCGFQKYSPFKLIMNLQLQINSGFPGLAGISNRAYFFFVFPSILYIVCIILKISFKNSYLCEMKEIRYFDTFQVKEFNYMIFSIWIYSIRFQTMISIGEKPLLLLFFKTQLGEETFLFVSILEYGHSQAMYKTVLLFFGKNRNC